MQTTVQQCGHHKACLPSSEVRQGCPLGPTLFALYDDGLEKHLLVNADTAAFSILTLHLSYKGLSVSMHLSTLQMFSTAA